MKEKRCYKIWLTPAQAAHLKSDKSASIRKLIDADRRRQGTFATLINIISPQREDKLW